MTRRNKRLFWLGLGIYGFLLFLLLSLYRLPADRIIGKVLTRITETRVLVSAETVSFALPISYTLETITCEAFWPQGTSKDQLGSLVFAPEWSRLFSGSIPIRSEVIFPRGRVEARLGVPFVGQGYFDAKGSGVHLEDLSFVEILLGRLVTGKCDGEMRLRGDVRFPSGLDGQGFLRATDGSLESRIPLRGLSTIPFQSISAFLNIQKGLLFLNDGNIAGPALSGNFSGEVRLDDIMSKSLLKIRAEIIPGPLLRDNDFTKQLIESLAAEGEPIVIHLGGTLDSPSIRWEKE